MPAASLAPWQYPAPPLHIAAAAGHKSVVATLLRSAAEPDTPVPGGITALIVAAQQGHADVVATLLRARADRSLATVSGFTAMHVAAQVTAGRRVGTGPCSSSQSRQHRLVCPTVCRT